MSTGKWNNGRTTEQVGGVRQTARRSSPRVLRLLTITACIHSALHSDNRVCKQSCGRTCMQWRLSTCTRECMLTLRSACSQWLKHAYSALCMHPIPNASINTRLNAGTGLLHACSPVRIDAICFGTHAVQAAWIQSDLHACPPL